MSIALADWRTARLNDYGLVRLVAGILVVLAASPVHAQELAGTFDQLRVLVKSGEMLTITDAAGQQTRGRLRQLTDTSLVIDVRGAQRTLQEIEVDTVAKRGSDSLKNGALTGMAIGAGFVGIAFASTGGQASFVLPALIGYAGIGAGIGAGIDALIEGQRVIYARSRQPSAVTIAPIFGRDRRGLAMSMRF